MRVEAVRVEARVGKQRGTGHGRAECAQRARGARAQRAHRILLHRCDRRRVEQQLVQRGHRLVRVRLRLRLRLRLRVRVRLRLRLRLRARVRVRVRVRLRLRLRLRLRVGVRANPKSFLLF